MEEQRGSTKAIREVLKLARGIQVEEMAKVAALAEKAGGGLVSVGLDGDDDWCGTGRIHFPFPIPHPDPWVKFLNALLERRINFEVLINGIPVPDEVLLRISRAQRW
jgi:hypothetical protein